MGKRTNTAVWLEKYSRWQIKVQKDGERKTFTSSTPGRTGQREANAKADAWMDDNISGGGTRVEMLLDEYIKSIEGTIAPETVTDRKIIIENWIKPHIGHKRIAKLTEGDLQDILDAAARKGINKKTGLNKKSIKNIRDVINMFLKYCRKHRYTTLNTEFLTIPISAPSNERRILQPDSLSTLMNIDTTVLYGKRQFDDYIHAYRFAALTGIRPGELLGLRWCDIIGDTVNIKRSINENGRQTTGKNSNALRSFALKGFTRNIIQEQRQISGSESVFEIESQSTFRHRWKKYCESNNVPSVSLYELRHTFVSIAKGLSDGELRQLVGHSKNMDTYGVYSHELAGDMQNTADKLDKIIGKIVKIAK